MSRVLVLNMGLKSTRSIIFSGTGEKLGFAAQPLSTQLNEEWVMQDPNEWWEKAQVVVRESMRNLHDKKVDYITVTTSSSCLTCVNEMGEALDRCIMVSDKRAKKESEYIKSLKSFIEVEKKTQLSMDSYLMLPKILWVKNNQKEIFSKTYAFLSPNDYLIGKMTGEFVTDCFNAQKYHYNLIEESYPTDLLSELEIPEKKLPVVREPGTVVGTLTLKAADELGINENAKVFISTYDAICSFFGSGVSKEGDASDASGTVTALRALSLKNDLLPSKKIFLTPFSRWNINIVGGSNNLGGGLIEWVKQCYYFNEAYPYEIMEKEAREIPIGSGGLIFLPYLLGERAPIWDCDARGVFFGLERTHTRRDMTRAVFESTGFIDLSLIEAIEETGMKVERLKLSGGLARNLTVAQIKADVTKLQVEILDDFETTAIGAAIFTLIGAGEYKSFDKAVEAFVKVRMIILPNEENSKYYSELYGLYKETYHTSKALFKSRKRIVDQYAVREISLENM